MIRAAALGAFLGGIIACAGGQRSAVAPPTAAGAEPRAPQVMGGDPHEQILALQKHIVDNGGAFVDRDAMASAAVPMSVAPKSTDATCHPAPTATCTDSCRLSDSICDDAKSICDIAAKLADDHWAAGKCESGTSSCTDAHARCCDCR